ncbi:unnamed protein product [Allacma fusca]|uniref:Uncharacterized protein n=1 Tax=Allacma fusca TaxID=39272 RepID=A0A8J2KVP3_9HEXA|nr:unnamed protein product [Allacma fusca]
MLQHRIRSTEKLRSSEESKRGIVETWNVCESLLGTGNPYYYGGRDIGEWGECSAQANGTNQTELYFCH